MRRERAVLLVHDDEFTALADEAGIEARLLAWTDRRDTDGRDSARSTTSRPRHAGRAAPRPAARTTAGSSS